MFTPLRWILVLSGTLLLAGLSGCGVLKGGDCDCPAFSENNREAEREAENQPGDFASAGANAGANAQTHSWANAQTDGQAERTDALSAVDLPKEQMPVR
ncbi:MAG: hypothetical protein GC205_09290 [Bacteroidetes bacterium]|nr:hypothetical protein [Bacteroidota bacterium]